MKNLQVNDKGLLYFEINIYSGVVSCVEVKLGTHTHEAVNVLHLNESRKPLTKYCYNHAHQHLLWFLQENNCIYQNLKIENESNN